MMTENVSLTPGSVVDKLRIDRVLGQGAFGITYLVTDTVLDKSFALKEYLLRGQVRRLEDGSLQPINRVAAESFASGLKQFIDEGRTVARLEHPSVVKVFRCFEANGTAYLLMPWYRGEALHKLLQRSGTFSQDELLALSGPLLDALAYIHANGVIHQDIKPANIYITQEGRPILLDFGAAGRLPQNSESTGGKLGSEGYAAPEQYERKGNIGPWTDFYGLAATLYRCISGRIPTPADQRKTAVDADRSDPLIAIAELAPAGENEAVLNAIGRGLALEPALRPSTALDWSRQFAPEVDREGREWLPIILLGVFFAALLSGVIYLFTPGGEVPPEAADSEAAQTQEPVKTVDRVQHASPEETARWKSALEADTAFGYQLFLEDYPESMHRDQALVHLERLDHQAWGQAQLEGTRAALEAYLENFPGGHHETDAEIQLNEIRLAEEAAERKRMELERQDSEAWETARTARTVAAMDEYLAAWPGGLHGDEARELRRQIQSGVNDQRAFEAAKKLNSIEGWKSYADAFPKGARIAEALEAIDRLTLRPGKSFRDCEACPTMVVIPAGSFWQGSEESAPLALKMETPRRMVTIARPFAVSRFEITMDQWDACSAAGACSTRPRDNGWGRGARPVIMVSWNDAQEFTSWLSKKTGQSYSLPSESEWEYLARAGEESDWLGGDAARVCEFGNIAGNESGFRWQHEDCADQAPMETLPVGSFRPNAFGIYDVVGNVAEWTLDCMNLSYLDAPADGGAWGRGICSSRMTRGGSWFTGTREVRLPARFNLKNGDRNDFTGFRVVRTVEEQ
jgi:formylglycine-generating enzyme required for sulfatase activity/serine/threonine protein kinase